MEQPGAFLSSLGKKASGPIEVTAVCTGSDKLVGHAISGHGCCEASILRRVFFRRQVAATAPRFIPDAPELYLAWIAAWHFATCSHVSSSRAARRRVTILDPLVKLLRAHSAHVDRHVRLCSGKLTETDELVGSELIRIIFPRPIRHRNVFRPFLRVQPEIRATRTLTPRPDAVTPIITIGKAAARPANH